MLQRPLRIAGLLLCLAAPWLNAQAADEAATDRREARIERREDHQQARIGQGLKSGELTAREAARLERQQARVERHERRVEADGKVTAREAASMERQQDRTSRHIYRQKHDGQARP